MNEDLLPVGNWDVSCAFSCVVACRSCLCVSNMVQVGTAMGRVQMSHCLICSYPDACRASLDKASVAFAASWVGLSTGCR